VQLFPETFWSETAIAVGAAIVVLALAIVWLAGQRAQRARALDAMVARLTRPATGVAQPGRAMDVSPGPLAPRAGSADQSVTNGASQ
jgi:hypothetical protein